ncbi:MAG: A24 family peptidase [Fuerstiella sp.]|jgi:leader peptidase (prepilin peptidase) / N-methyltransferase
MLTYFIIAALGYLLGRIGAAWAAVMLADMNSGGLICCPKCNAAVSAKKRWTNILPIRCPCGNAKKILWPNCSAIGLSLTFVTFAWLLLDPSMRCQSVHEVQPSLPLISSRLPFHLTLIFLLWVATLTDLLDYVIPDEVIYPGILIAVVSAAFIGELQLIHIWVNWDEALVSLNGPYLPEWMKHHQHLHGFAWSIAGLATGASITWLVRWMSETILGYPALGLGDATLMALVGSFVGWQPTLCILAIAPLAGLIIGMLAWLITGKTFVAFGPYLAFSTLVVISTWRWLWADYLTLRDIFSHWPSVLGLIGMAFTTLLVLLVLLRMFRSLPAESLKR